MSDDPSASAPTPSEPTQTTEPTSEPSLLEGDPPPSDSASLLGGEPAAPPAPDAPAFGDALEMEAFKELLPEGTELDEELAGPFLEALNKSNSRAELASNMLAFQESVATKVSEQMAEQWGSLQREWKAETQAHPTLGGENYAKSLATARGLIETYAENPAALKQMLTLSGAGNSVHMVQLLNKLAELIPSEAEPVKGDVAPTDKNRATILFGGSQT